MASGTTTDEAHRWVDERAELRELVYSAATSLRQPVDSYFLPQSCFAGGIGANKGWMYVATDAVDSLALRKFLGSLSAAAQATDLTSRAEISGRPREPPQP